MGASIASTRPDFLVVGSPKAGTTYLYHYLLQHPEIFLPAVKEPRYFAFHGQRFSGPGDDQLLRQSVLDDESYRQLFSRAKPGQLAGEMSATYLSSPLAPVRIAKAAPHAKLIAVLRQPAQRAFSQWIMHRRLGHEPLGFPEALDAEAGRLGRNWSPLWAYRGRGMYGEQLARYYDHFPASQILVLDYEQLSREQDTVLSRIYRFLGVSEFRPKSAERHNESTLPVNAVLHRWMTRPNAVKSALERVLPPYLLDRIHLRLLRPGRWKPASYKPILAQDQETALLRSFDDDIGTLERLTGLNFTHWRRPDAR